MGGDGDKLADKVDLAEQGDRRAVRDMARKAERELAELGYIDSPTAEWLLGILTRLQNPFSNDDAYRVIAPAAHPGPIRRHGMRRRSDAVSRVNELRREGLTVAEACQRVADERSVSPHTVRTWYYRRE